MCWFLPYNNANHPLVYIYVYIPPSSASRLQPPSYPPTFHPSRSSQSTGLGSLCIQQVSTTCICFIHCDVYMSVLLFQFIPPSSSLTVSTRLSAMSVSLFLSCLYDHQYSFSSFHMYALTMFVFLSSLCITGLVYFILTDSNSSLKKKITFHLLTPFRSLDSFSKAYYLNEI